MATAKIRLNREDPHSCFHSSSIVPLTVGSPVYTERRGGLERSEDDHLTIYGNQAEQTVSPFFLKLAICVLISLHGSASAETVISDRERLNQQFTAAVEELARQSEDPSQRNARLSVILRRDPSRQYFFVPASTVDTRQTSTDDPELARILGIYGNRLFNLAERAAAQGDGSTAFRWLHEVLRYAPDHSEAKRITSVSTADAFEIRPSRRAHAKYGWRAGEYLQIDTPSFRISTNGNEASARSLAESLELVNATWRQLFFEYWSNTATLRTALGGRPLTSKRRARHQVVLFRNREEYIAEVSRIEPQAEMTLGYYHAPSRTAFFFGDRSNASTWRHEATHQLFHESKRTKVGTGEAADFWIVEGIALYMESLQRCQGHITLGGLEADRLQFARFRRLREGFYEPLDGFTQLGRLDLQQHPQIRKLYSQSAGLTHFLMHYENGRYRKALLEYLNQVYSQRTKANSLEILANRTHAELDQEYQRFLDLNDTALQQIDSDATIRRLSLGGTRVTDAGLSSLRSAANLLWLDVAGLQVSDMGLEMLRDADLLEQLTLESTNITNATVGRLRNCQNLQELDLSNTSIDDQALATVGELNDLQSLWLTGTKVTDAGLPQLRALKKLQTLDISQTAVTPNGRAEIGSSLPQLD